MTTKVWRLIEDYDKSGSFQMAADQILFQRENHEMPILRLYTWNELTLSIGKNQPLNQDVNLEWCLQHQIPVIRRSTGGKAVLHGNDLTYSITASNRDVRFSGGVVETYKTISQAFVLFFEKLGLQPIVQPHSSRKRIGDAHVCFVMPSAYEILIAGKKIIGSAQRQSTKAFLQHGTIPLENQIGVLSEVFCDTSAQELAQEITSLADEEVKQTFLEIRQVLLECFEEVFEVVWESHQWTPQELQRIHEAEQKFMPLTL